MSAGRACSAATIALLVRYELLSFDCQANQRRRQQNCAGHIDIRERGALVAEDQPGAQDEICHIGVIIVAFSTANAGQGPEQNPAEHRALPRESHHHGVAAGRRFSSAFPENHFACSRVHRIPDVLARPGLPASYPEPSDKIRPGVL